jgi:drug/metabolite transporter (DMT)-like permease
VPRLNAVAGALLLAASAPLVRLAGTPPTITALYRCAFALPLLAVARGVLAPPALAPRSRGKRWFAMGVGSLLAIDLDLWHHAISAVGVGLATVLGNLQVGIVPLLAWLFLGQRPPRGLLVASPLLAAGLVLISGLGLPHAFGNDPAQGVIFGALASIAYAAFILLFRSQTTGEAGIARPLFDATAGATATLLLVAAAQGELGQPPSLAALGWLLLLAISAQVFGWLLIATAMPALHASEVSTILLLQPAGAMVLGRLLFREHPSGTQMIGVGVLIAGITCATLRRGSIRGRESTATLSRPRERSATATTNI